MLIDYTLGSSMQPLLEKAAAFAERRHDVLAGNLANVSTPGYQTRDLPVEQFQTALRKALESRLVAPESGATSSMGFPADDESLGLWSWNGAESPQGLDPFPKELFKSVKAASQTATFQDGANRSIETEVMELTKNSMMQTMAIELMTSQFNKLQAVISERA
jgi:flagellar basal-body rod protein FlgB